MFTSLRAEAPPSTDPARPAVGRCVFSPQCCPLATSSSPGPGPPPRVRLIAFWHGPRAAGRCRGGLGSWRPRRRMMLGGGRPGSIPVASGRGGLRTLPSGTRAIQGPGPESAGLPWQGRVGAWISTSEWPCPALRGARCVAVQARALAELAHAFSTKLAASRAGRLRAPLAHSSSSVRTQALATRVPRH
jgi:hypothetical protein